MQTIKKGQRIGMLTVIGACFLAKKYGLKKRHYAKCVCDCGNESMPRVEALLSGNTKGCGCISRTTHGKSRTVIYSRWKSMINRCYREKDIAFSRYGGRGIRVCDRWHYSFENFYLDMGDPPKGKTLDRIDANGGYSPANCRWATHTEQGRNKRNNKKLTAFGKTMTLSEWSDRLGIGRCTISYRIKKGWTAERAVSRPIARKKVLPKR